MTIEEANILQGLQVPKDPVRVAKTSGVKVVILKPKLTTEELKKREGTYFTEKDVDKIYSEDIDIWVEDDTAPEGKRLLAKLRRNVIPHDVLEVGWKNYYNASAASRNRGAAAGPIDLKSKYWTRRKPTEIKNWTARYIQDGKVSKMRVNNNVFSSVLGYFEQTPFMGLPCRLTSYTQKYFNEYKGGLPFIESIDDLFKKLIPDRHKAQLEQAHARPGFQINDTAFSSITMNRNFRTGLHMDDGDLRKGFGNLTVIERGKYHGGYTIFPRYKIGFDLRSGDFLAMDVHEWHCNTELYETPEDKEYNKSLPEIYKNNKETGTQGVDKKFCRLSFVCYLREKLVKCKASESNSYYKKIGYNPKTNTMTRKNHKSKDAKGKYSDAE